MIENCKKSSSFKNAEAYISGYRLEADGKGSYVRLTVSGIQCISGYSSENIVILTKKEKLELSGKSMELKVLEDKNLEICGIIENISINSKRR